MLIVTGATGQLGRAILQDLLIHMDAAQIGASARNPDKAADLTAKGVRVRHGDFTDPAGLRHAFEGATQVLIVSSNAEASGGDAAQQHGIAIAAARAAGARRILYTSHMGTSATSKFLPMRTHAATEALLRDSGVPFTSLRNGFYASSAMMMMGDVPASRTIAAPRDGKVSWTTHADLAAAAAAILMDEGRFDGPTPPLTALAALDFAELATIAGDVLGTPIERREVPDDAYFEQAVAHGMPQPVARIMRGFYEAARDGEFAAVDPTLVQLLGRSPVSMRQALAERLT